MKKPKLVVMESSDSDFKQWWVFKSAKDAIEFAAANEIDLDDIEKLANGLYRIPRQGE